jgi:hypothetical protein
LIGYDVTSGDIITSRVQTKFRNSFCLINKFFHNFHLSESSFTCPRLLASGLARRLLLELIRFIVALAYIYLYFPYCISLIYFSFTKIRMFLYARIYWLAEFGDVSCLQFNYLRVETHSLCTRDNRCQDPFTCCRQLPVYDIGCVCSFTCLPNVGRTNQGK